MTEQELKEMTDRATVLKNDLVEFLITRNCHNLELWMALHEILLHVIRGMKGDLAAERYTGMINGFVTGLSIGESQEDNGKAEPTVPEPPKGWVN